MNYVENKTSYMKQGRDMLYAQFSRSERKRGKSWSSVPQKLTLDPIQVAASEVEGVKGGGPEDGLHEGTHLLHKNCWISKREEADVKDRCLEQGRLHLD